MFKPARAGWWYVDLVEIREQGDTIHVVDHYVDIIVGPPGLPYRVAVARTASVPTDPVPGNDSAATTCTVVTPLLVSCG
ncbi:hypothetical protein ACFQ1S_28450 [Kibdelosporangium lantanae]|uniref:DUF402 domain-containing protein n=1 Tax=Kibdelosporangium lantanae TaxID=1497396 RepID=A0ABW3MEZ7_9PSEU